MMLFAGGIYICFKGKSEETSAHTKKTPKPANKITFLLGTLSICYLNMQVGEGGKLL